MLTNAPKGTKDMMPDQAYKWHYIEEAFAEICRTYGFEEIRTPVFEHTELFQRGVGDTTDIVQKEMYSFQDYGKRNITLKPEGTSPVVRAYAEHKMFAGPQPTKFYYNTPCFRYEKPQSGRLREFHQFGIETFGTHDMMADAEIIALASDFLKKMRPPRFLLFATQPLSTTFSPMFSFLSSPHMWVLLYNFIATSPLLSEFLRYDPAAPWSARKWPYPSAEHCCSPAHHRRSQWSFLHVSCPHI